MVGSLKTEYIALNLVMASLEVCLKNELLIIGNQKFLLYSLIIESTI